MPVIAWQATQSWETTTTASKNYSHASREVTAILTSKTKNKAKLNDLLDLSENPMFQLLTHKQEYKIKLILVLENVHTKSIHKGSF